MANTWDSAWGLPLAASIPLVHLYGRSQIPGSKHHPLPPRGEALNQARWEKVATNPSFLVLRRNPRYAACCIPELPNEIMCLLVTAVVMHLFSSFSSPSHIPTPLEKHSGTTCQINDYPKFLSYHLSPVKPT